MVGTARTLMALTVIAQVCAALADRHHTAVYEAGRYAELQRAGLLSLAAVAVLALVASTTAVVAAVRLRDEGGGWGWVLWAACVFCLVSQGVAFVGRHTVGYLVLAVLHVVFGLALSTSVRHRRVPTASPRSS